MTIAPELLTHSRSQCAATCLRKHYYRYEIGLRPDHEPEHLRVGSLFHYCLESRDKGLDDDEIAAHVYEKAYDEFEAQKVLRMYLAYVWRWEDDDMEVIETEKAFVIPIRNPATGKTTPRWKNAGKRDRIVRLADGRLALQEYKTTTESIAPDSVYWARLRLDPQVSRYVLAARAEGIDIETVLYDVTVRPGLRPLKATPLESRKYKKTTGELYANQRETDETPDAYGDRTTESIVENPDKFFARQEIARLDDDIAEFEAELWQQQQMLGDARKYGRRFKNPGSCFKYNTPCEYLHICADRTPVAPDLDPPPGFMYVDDLHPELEIDPAAQPEGVTST